MSIGARALNKFDLGIARRDFLSKQNSKDTLALNVLFLRDPGRPSGWLF